MKTLVIYFSWSGNTKNIIDEINKKFSFDTVRVERKVPYSSDYNTCAYVEAKKEVDENIYPEIKSLNVDVNNYERILLFFPIWWYTFPMPIGTLIDGMKNFKGEVVVFANSYTNDISYMKNSMRDLRNIAPNVNFKEALFNKSISDHLKFIERL